MTTLTVAMEQRSFSQDITNNYLESCLGILNNVEIDDLENIIMTELVQGLPSDTEIVSF